MIRAVTVAVILIIGMSSSRANFLQSLFNTDFYQQVSSNFGANGVARVQEWQQLIQEVQGASDYIRLNRVNTFFNQNVTYANDIDHWKQKDYWATPVETLATGSGDCEDYAIAKYVSLRAAGIPDEKLRMMYVRALSVNEPHMVLIYLQSENAIPLVLDNMVSKVLPASRRADLKPIYGFNAEGLWMAKAKGLGRKVEGRTGGTTWLNVLDRIEKGM